MTEKDVMPDGDVALNINAKLRLNTTPSSMCAVADTCIEKALMDGTTDFSDEQCLSFTEMNVVWPENSTWPRKYCLIMIPASAQ